MLLNILNFLKIFWVFVNIKENTDTHITYTHKI